MRLYYFGDGKAEGSGTLRETLGSKGADLAELTRLGAPVPPGFTLPVEVGRALLDNPEQTIKALRPELRRYLARLEEHSERTFGSTPPLLVSVRGGATTPMPGALATLLNVGLNPQTCKALGDWSQNPRAALRIYTRYQREYGALIGGVDDFYFEEELDDVRRKAGLRFDDPITIDALQELVQRYEELIETWAHRPLPHDPHEQLEAAILAVAASYNNERARHFRDLQSGEDPGGCGLNVQMMVFGTLDAESGAGVMWTRHRNTGYAGIDGDFLFEAQGEDVLHGLREAISLREDAPAGLATEKPQLHRSLRRLANLVEGHYRRMHRIEFTVERGELFVLQTRPSRAPLEVTLQVCADMVDEGLIADEDALRRIDAEEMHSLLHPRLAPNHGAAALTRGLATSPGAATGFAVFSAQEAERFAELNMNVILVKNETTPDDIRAMRSARGIVTTRGGMTSHAAVVTRQMGKPSVVGCARVRVDARKQTLQIGEKIFRQGDVLTIDGSSGEIFEGELALMPPDLPESWHRVMGWADQRRTIEIRGNADSAGDAALARRLGATGIGLVRTEHMFFRPGRINAMREVILAQNPQQRKDALARIEPHQTQDFEELLIAMDGLPVTIRLLDPPLHEFLPRRSEDLEAIGDQMGIAARDVKRIANNLRESNPMLGHRGCRLAISWPEIYDMQTRAIVRAMERAQRKGATVRAELLIPLVSDPAEFRYVRQRLDTLYQELEPAPGMPERLRIGSMIEVARACLLAGEIAREADFLSIGSNDLTQSVYGLSRDDASTFLPAYLDAGLMKDNPFHSLDLHGVGALIELACERARATRADISIGLCGEQGSNVDSVGWLQNGVVDYISCSPYRVPIARLAAGQATVLQRPRSRDSRE